MIIGTTFVLTSNLYSNDEAQQFNSIQFNIYCIKYSHIYSSTVTKKRIMNFRKRWMQKNTNTTIISVALNTLFLILLAKNINFDKFWTVIFDLDDRRCVSLCRVGHV